MRETKLPNTKWSVYIHELDFPRIFQTIRSLIKGERYELYGGAVLQKIKETFRRYERTRRKKERNITCLLHT